MTKYRNGHRSVFRILTRHVLISYSEKYICFSLQEFVTNIYADANVCIKLHTMMNTHSDTFGPWLVVDRPFDNGESKLAVVHTADINAIHGRYAENGQYSLPTCNVM